MAKRQVFFSFHYDNDNWRAGQVRNMGKVDSSSTFSDNDWEEVKEKTESKIKEWIDEQLNKRSCLVVLIGEKTANRKWINYEIKKAYELNKGIVSRREDDYCIECSEDGIRFKQMRICHMWACTGKIKFGILLA